MNPSRRHFIKTGVIAAAGVMVLPESAISNTIQQWNKKDIKTALQLYSVRDAMKNEPVATLKALAKMGYKYLEHASYSSRKFYGMSPADFKNVLDDLGLKMPSGHTVLHSSHWDSAKKDFTDEWKYLVEDAAYMGQKFVISPSLEESIRRDYSKLLHFMDVFNRSGELCKSYGMRFGYHNHDFEFREQLNGTYLWDIMVKNTEKDKVVMQLDTGNMYVAGAKAKELLERYPDRYDNIHVKDMISKSDGTGMESTVVGSGLLPMKEILDLAKKSGTKLFIIEQEAYQGKDPLDCMKENYNMMRSWSYL